MVVLPARGRSSSCMPGLPHRKQALPSHGERIMTNPSSSPRVAILATDGFEQAELLEPKRALEAAGILVDVISARSGTLQGFKHVEKGEQVKVDKTFAQAHQEDYAAVVLPGGVVNGDAMRLAADFGRTGEESHRDQLAKLAGRLQECRRQMGRSRSGAG